MKNLIKVLVSTVILSSVLASNVSASQEKLKLVQTNKVDTKIEKVYYDKENNIVYANTAKDENNGFWTLEVSNNKWYFDAYFFFLKADLEGRKVNIEYTGDIKNYNEVDIVDFDIDYGKK